MKKHLLTLFFLGICIFSYAQESGGSSSKKTKTNTNNTTTTNTTNKMKAWDWKDYNVKFQAPLDFKITRSDGNAFVAENGKINLSIYPKKGENLSTTAMKSSLLAWAKENKVTDYDEAHFTENLKGFKSYYVDGKVGEFPTSLLLLVNPDAPDISLYVWVSYAASELDTAVEIIKSFKPFE